MRPIKVEFQAFGPYSGHESVDFEDISSRGIFLICGKTGIGKTMIIDAMTFALFGKSSGNGRDDLAAMRCTRADFKTSTTVSFEFEHNGVHYRFQRRLDRKTKNLSVSRDVSIRGDDGVWRSVFENAKKEDLNRKAEEVIGLTYDQFRQVIVLPQGQFEKLLTSDSNEKEKILTSIFGVDKWKRIAECFLEDALARSDELIGIRDRILASIADEGCDDLEDLRSSIEQKEIQLVGIEKEYAEAGYEDRINEFQELLKVSGRLTDLRNNLKDREKEAVIASKYVTDSKESLASAEKALKSHMDKAEDIANNGRTKIVYEGKREYYRGLDAAVSALHGLEKDKKTAEKEKTLAEKTVETCAGSLTALKKEYEALDREHKQLMDRYIAGITGELARDLVHGQPCPVCGSTDHPQKAGISAESVSREDVEGRKQDAEAKYEEMNNAADRQEKAKSELEKRKTAVNDLDSKVKIYQSKLDELRKSLVEGIDTAEELENEIGRLAESITAYDETKKTLEASEKAARENLSQANEKVTRADAELEKAKLALEEALTELEGRKIQPEDDIKTKLDECIETAKAHSEKTGALKKEIERLKSKEDMLRSESEGLREKILRAEADVAFGKKLRGDTGTGLQRYVLGIMFSSVVAEANRMLEMVHGGRYRLFRTDDKGKGNKRGLELKVHDRNSDEHDGRFVGTLSGGEKFLAALALSIGMANVARKSGIGIDALFIDEGFGTLDEESIGDAMSVLSSIQKSKGIVGIISHMQILRDNIPTKLRVEGDSDGSHIVRDVG